MARSSSRKRYARASSLRTRRRRTTARWFRLSVAFVVIAGSLLVAQARQARRAEALPGIKVGQHWHAALGVMVCGSWKGNGPEFTKDSRSGVYAGVHTHADGLIHMEPNGAVDAHGNANLGRWFRYGGWSLTKSSLRLWDGTREKNGNKCPDSKAAGTLQWFLNGKKQNSDPAKHVFAKDGEIVAIVFGPSIKSLPSPVPSLPRLREVERNPSLGETQPSTVPGETPSTAPGATTTATGTQSTAPGATTTAAGAPSTTAAPTTTKP
jgi:hypothetical protein